MNASEPCANERTTYVDIGVVVRKAEIPTRDFELVRLGENGSVTPGPNGPGQIIDLSDVDGDVTLRFTLIDLLGLHFPAMDSECIGIKRSDKGCPDQPENDHSDVFEHHVPSKDRRQLHLRKLKNNQQVYHFALFMVDANGKNAAHCDPRIINR